jgi:hypothetical protein
MAHNRHGCTDRRRVRPGSWYRNIALRRYFAPPRSHAPEVSYVRELTAGVNASRDRGTNKTILWSRSYTEHQTDDETWRGPPTAAVDTALHYGLSRPYLRIRTML